MKVSILGVGSYVPPRKLTNLDLQKMVDTSDEWIVERTGIRERYVAESQVATSDLGVEAARLALSQSRVGIDEIDLLVVSTMTPDMLSPSTACIVQTKLGASRAACFDISAACSGSVYAMDVAKKFLESGQYKRALVIGAEKLSSIVDWTDRGTCILFGDGAGAAVLGPGDQGHEIVGICLGADGSGQDALKIPAGGSLIPASRKSVDEGLHFIQMDGKEVYERAIDMMTRISVQTLRYCSLSVEDIALFIPHQANKRIIDSVAKKMGLPPEKVFVNVDRYGNTSAASIILAIDDAARQQRIKRGQKVLVAVFGAGFTWGGAVIQW